MTIQDLIREILSSDDKAAFEKDSHGIAMGFGKRPAILVVDMKNDTVNPSYSLGHGNLTEQAAENIRTLLDEARAVNIPIIYTRAYDRDIHSSVHGISLKRFAMPSKKKAHANEIISILTPKDKDVVIEKGKASAFFGTPLLTILTTLAIDTLIVTGAATSGCVRATVTDGASYGYHVIVPIECCGDRSLISHKVNLIDMYMKYADVLTLSEVTNYLRAVKVAAVT